MYNNLYKYKPYFSWLIKLGIVSAAIYFIYQKLAYNELLSFELFKKQVAFLLSNKLWTLILVLFFTDANWILEIFKWKTLVSTIKKTSFIKAYEQCLASQTVSIITPNRIGEYGAKALYFEKEKRKKIVFLNLIGNLTQLIITIVFGLIGMVYIFSYFNLPSVLLNFQNTLIILVIIFLILFFRKKLKLPKLFKYFKTINPKIIYKTLCYSFLRYVVFSHQFYFLLILFEIEATYLSVMNLLFCMYFLASTIPSLSIFDWAIKGSLAVWLFSYVQVNELTILTITTLMWLLNVVFPAIIGSFFVLKFNSKKVI